MKKFFILVLGMIMLMLIPINVKADDEVEIGVDQEESNIEYVEIDQEMESFSVGHKVSLSINPNVEKRMYKLEANKYVRLKFIYSSTSRVKVGIVNKSRNKVALKEIKSNDIQKIKVPKKDTYSIYIQNNSGKKITVSGVIIIL